MTNALIYFDIGYGTGCDVEGFAYILADNQEVDTYEVTSLDPIVVDDGWIAAVEGDLYQTAITTELTLASMSLIQILGKIPRLLIVPRLGTLLH